MAAGGSEDLMQNPFLRVLRSSFASLYRLAAVRGEDTALLVPCAESLEVESFSQVFMEAHLLKRACVPGLYMNLLGQGVEIRESSVSTHLCWAESRVCEVLQSESMYESDYCSTFRVFVIDKPLLGKYKTLTSAVGRSSSRSGTGAAGPASGAAASGAVCVKPEDWLNAAPMIQDSFYEEVDRFRKTFVQVPGCEQSTAERIRELVSDACKRLIRHHKLTQQKQHRQLDYYVSRNAYAALHSFVWPHLQRILEVPEERLGRAIRSYGSSQELAASIPGAQGRDLGGVDVRACSEQMDLVGTKITPHEKIECVNEAHASLQRCVEQHARSSGPAPQKAVEITGDDVLSLFILAVYRSSLQDRLAHVAHVEMYMQGAAGRGGGSDGAALEEAGYALTVLQGALQFFLEERRGVDAPRASAARATTSVFSSYLQPGEPAAPEPALEAEGAGGQLPGLVRHARAQASGGGGGAPPRR